MSEGTQTWRCDCCGEEFDLKDASPVQCDTCTNEVCGECLTEDGVCRECARAAKDEQALEAELEEEDEEREGEE